MDQINRTGSSTTKQQSPQHPEHLDDEKIQRNSKETEGTTNEYVLNVAFVSFLLFVVLEGIFAVIAKSEAMMTDVICMSVDAFTYLFNLVAERLKQNPPIIGSTENISTSELLRKRKEMRLYLEFIPPVISVSVLVGVSIQALQEAINTIIQVNHPVMEVTAGGSIDHDDDAPDVDLMFIFSALNLALDIINVTCFAKAGIGSLGMTQGKIVGTGIDYSKYDDKNDDENDAEYGQETDKLLEQGSHSTHSSTGHGDNYGTSIRIEMDDDISVGSLHDSDISEDPSEGSSNMLNLNMCSAYTHIMADTLRSIAVLLAAGIAFVFKSIDPSIADASASIVVSIIIALSLGPLLVGLSKTWKQISELRTERSIEIKESRKEMDADRKSVV